MTEIAILHTVLFQNVDKLATDERIEYGREVKIRKKRQRTLTAQPFSFGETDLKPARLAVDDLFVINAFPCILKPFLHIPAAASADDVILDLEGIIVEEIDRRDVVLSQNRLHFCNGRPPEIVITLADYFVSGQTVEKFKVRNGIFKRQPP